MYAKFRQLLDTKGITPYMLSKATGISQVTLTDWKHGRSKPKADKLLKIAKYLNVPVEELICEEEVKE